jgi:hypothetical protein
LDFTSRPDFQRVTSLVRFSSLQDSRRVGHGMGQSPTRCTQSLRSPPLGPQGVHGAHRETSQSTASSRDWLCPHITFATRTLFSTLARQLQKKVRVTQQTATLRCTCTLQVGLLWRWACGRAQQYWTGPHVSTIDVRAHLTHTHTHTHTHTYTRMNTQASQRATHDQTAFSWVFYQMEHPSCTVAWSPEGSARLP